MESSSNDSQTKLVSHEPIVTDGRKSFHNSDAPSGSSSRYGYYRGGHVFNGVTEFSSKRSAGRGSGNHSPNSNHGSSFSPHTGHSNVRPARDSGEARYRRPFKSFTTDDAVTQNHALVDGKHVRILQRPLPSAGRLHAESGRGDDADGHDKSSPDALRQQQQQLKRGHRKKTLSLNPEEREALENLVEEVIIDGLGEAIIDSDGSSSSDDDDCDSKVSQPECRPDAMIGKDSGYNIVKDSRLNSGKGNLKDTGAAGDKHHSAKNLRRNISPSNGKDYKGRGRETTNGSGAKGVKDVKRGSDLRHVKSSPPEEEKEKPNAATVRGVNIYPAQLKVAIKHMDSLPPRFLRRLQTGTSRTAGNESILARLTVKSPTDVQQSAEMVRTDDASISPTDRDRGKAKQNQLQETKKTIRNLLCDLDQYTDETVSKDYPGGGRAGTSDKGGTNPVLQDSSGGTLAPGMPVCYGQPYVNKPPHISPNSLQPGAPSPSQALQQQSFPFLAPAPHGAVPRMLSCEEIEREMLHGTQPLNATPAGTESTAVPVPPEVAGGMPSFYPPAAPVSHLPPQVSHAQQQQPKKSQFSVDAPEFVSSYYMPNRGVTKHVSVAQPAEPYYAVPPPMHNAEMGVQILHDNVHLPAKQVQYPVSVMPPPSLPQSASNGQEFVDIPPGTAVAPTSYEMLQYDHMNAQSIGMLRNTSPYVAPASVQMPLPVSGQGDGVSPMLEMDAMGYPAYQQYIPGSNAYSTSYAAGPGFSQTAQPSFMPMPVAAGPSMSSPNWIGDGSSQSQMTPAGWYPEYASMPYATTDLPPTRQPGFEDAIYAGGSLAYGEQQMMNSGGVEKWSYVARAPVEAGRQKVQQLLNDGASVMVILIGSPDADNLSLVRLEAALLLL